MTDSTTPAAPSAAAPEAPKAAVVSTGEPAFKAAISSGVAAVEAEVSSLWTKAKPYAIAVGALLVGALVGIIVK